MSAIESFYNYQGEIAKLEYLSNLLNWDLQVNSPIDGKEYLIDVKSDIETKSFQLKTQEKYEEVLKNAIQSDEFSQLSSHEQIYIRQLLEDYTINKRVPIDFYKDYQILKAKANTIWEEAKEKNDYSLFKPYLEKIITMTKDYYRFLYPKKDLYDAMLDSYEKGMTTKEIDQLFEPLKKALIPIIQSQKKEYLPIYQKEYTTSELLECAHFLLDYIGFDLKRGSLGIYPHGFTEKIHKDDIRIAFSKTDNPISFVSTIIHEGGHGIFEQNMDPNISNLNNEGIEHIYGLHESQSRFFENIIGRNFYFWKPIYPKIQKLLHLDMPLEEFVARLNEVKNGPVRTEADELTYCLHIIIRYEIERDIFHDRINLEDLPSIWNQKVKDYLGIDVKNDQEGILQDVHWSDGSFGYFPSYLLGTIYDGMFLKAIEKDLGPIQKLLENGEMDKIKEYFTQNIYQHGNTKTAKQIIYDLCGEEINIQNIIHYFENKYKI